MIILYYSFGSIPCTPGERPLNDQTIVNCYLLGCSSSCSFVAWLMTHNHILTSYVNKWINICIYIHKYIQIYIHIYKYIYIYEYVYISTHPYTSWVAIPPRPKRRNFAWRLVALQLRQISWHREGTRLPMSKAPTFCPRTESFVDLLID